MTIVDIIQGVNQFHDTCFNPHQEVFQQLSQGQTPDVLFITCADSRVDPFLITQARPGELFVMRNVGNIIPAHSEICHAEGAGVEYAVQALEVKDIIVCGHSHCGAVKGLLQVGQLAREMPLVYGWLKHTEATRRLMVEHYAQAGYDEGKLLKIAIEQNVLTQIENLKTYPVIRSKLHAGTLNLHAWVYGIEAGVVFAYNARVGTFVPLATQPFPLPDPLLAKESRGRRLWLQAMLP